MKKLVVRTAAPQTVLSELARALDTSSETENGVSILSLPQSIGQGRLLGLPLKNGINFYSLEGTLSKELHLQFDANSVQPLRIHFCHRGTTQHRHINIKKFDALNAYQYLVVNGGHNRSQVMTLPAGRPFSSCMLEIDPERYLQALNKDRINLSKKMEALLNATPDEKDLRPFYCSHHVLDMLQELFQSKQEGYLYRLLLESACYKLLYELNVQFDEDLRFNADLLEKRQQELDQIRQVASIIVSEMRVPLNIDQLATRVGANINTLQMGFKIIYGSTINDFINEQRLRAARGLLLKNDKSISEIVAEIGLSNRGYFSKMFKKRFGMLPQQYRNHHRQKSE